MSKKRTSKDFRPDLSTEQMRALLLLNESPAGLSEDEMLANGITKETMESLARLGLVEHDKD